MSNVIGVTFVGLNRGRTDNVLRRYGVLLSQLSDGAVVTGIVITDNDIGLWAKENGYAVKQAFRFNQAPEKNEKTNLTKPHKLK